MSEHMSPQAQQIALDMIERLQDERDRDFAELTRLRKENAELLIEHEQIVRGMYLTQYRYKQQRDDTQYQLTKAWTALKWYADKRTWNQWLPDSAGNRARTVLAEAASVAESQSTSKDNS